MSIIQNFKGKEHKLLKLASMKMKNDTREDIVIVGGGICGLATALALHRKGIRSLVVERSERLRATGAAIIMQANGWRALDQLGVASYLRQTAIQISSGKFNSLSDNKTQELPVGTDEIRCLRRTDLMNILADTLPENTVRFGCTVISVEFDPITSFPVLHFQDGTRLNAKVVIGCDGVNSTVSNMLGVTPRSIINVYVVRGFTNYPCGHSFGSEFKMIRKDDVQVGITPMSTSLVYWFVTRKHGSQEFKISRDQKVIEDMAVGLVREFPTVIREMMEKCSLESLHLSEYLRCQAPWDILRGCFRAGTVTVAGDAFHAMTPFIAQGGAASLEDAVVLARCLARKTSLANTIEIGRGSKLMIEEAFDEYLKERRQRVFRLSLQAYLIANMEETSSKFIKFLCIVCLVVVFRDSHGHNHYDCGSL